LKLNSILKMLTLSNNQIGDEGAIALGEGLKVNTSLLALALHNNHIGDKGAIALNKNVLVNSTLKTLSLRNNKIRISVKENFRKIVGKRIVFQKLFHKTT